MTDKQWKANIRKIKDPRKLLTIIGADDFNLGVDGYYGDLWDAIFAKAKELGAPQQRPAVGNYYRLKKSSMLED